MNKILFISFAIIIICLIGYGQRKVGYHPLKTLKPYYPENYNYIERSKGFHE